MPLTSPRVSNCVFRAPGLPIVRAASRLALRAPARRAAAALTRLARWALCSSSGRHGVPAGSVVDPVGSIAQHGIQDADHLVHNGDDGDLWLLAGGEEPAVKGLQRRVEKEGGKSRHIEHVADRHATAIDVALSPELAAVEIVGREADEGGDRLAADRTELGQ